MATILDRYGIKEVADVTFYEIKDDGTMGAPVLFLDTLKVSTIEQTAEQVEARGGKGNVPLVVWDFGKEINLTLEDALFSAKSMAIMFGDTTGANRNSTNPAGITKTMRVSYSGNPYSVELPTGATISIDPTDGTYYDIETNEVVASPVSSTDYYFTYILPVSYRTDIEISASTFPGTYCITGDTYARSQITGKDEFFQFIIPKAKLSSSVTLTLQAEGDPSTFSMTLRVLRPDDGKMMKLVQYSVNESASTATITSVTNTSGTALEDDTLTISTIPSTGTATSAIIKVVGTNLTLLQLGEIAVATGSATPAAGKTTPTVTLSTAVYDGAGNTKYKKITVTYDEDVATTKWAVRLNSTNGNLVKKIYIDATSAT